MVSVGDMKYLKARSRLSLSKHSALSSGSFTVLHIRSAMLRAALCRSSWSDSLHRYLRDGVRDQLRSEQTIASAKEAVFYPPFSTRRSGQVGLGQRKKLIRIRI